MDDLRLVRREDQSLIVATESGEEFRLVVDETVLAEFRHLARPPRSATRANPREVQALVRAGKTREEIARATGLEEGDIARYEEPVLAERRYILELAQAVAVRTSPGDEVEQQFGTVIAERLVGLGAEDPEWSSWRDEELGWMVSLSFTSRDSDHRAVWSFEHRKGVLSPLTPDAESLSKQGGVGDRLIPKLRAVDSDERFDSGAFDPERLTAELDTASLESDEEPRAGRSGPVAPDHPSTGSIPVVDSEAEYARRQHIEERAIKTPEPELPDLGQTADLLDALRRRRGQRDAAESGADEGPDGDLPDDARTGTPTKDPVQLPGRATVTPIGSTSSGGSSENRGAPDALDLPVPLLEDRRADGARGRGSDSGGSADADDRAPADDSADADDPQPKQPLGPAPDRGRRGKGRASIPSWDDILFGTRSEDDPA